MKLISIGIPNKTDFLCINVGDAFLLNGSVYIKTDKFEQAVNLENGETFTVSRLAKVHKLEATIEYKII